MQTIITKYSPATDTRGSRILATSTNGDRWPFPSEPIKPDRKPIPFNPDNFEDAPL